jgi:hypothetical protein
MEKDQETLFEQYKILVETTSKISDWRQSTNNFYLAVNTTLIAIATYLVNSSQKTSLMICLVGIIISILWYENIVSYKKINKAKFKVIHKMEEELPLGAFSLEKRYYEGDDCKELTSIERYVPAVFGLLYLIIPIGSYFKIL